MKIEFEITFMSIDKDNIKEKLKKIWWICVKKEVLIKRIAYDMWKNAYARIRDEWDKITCTYKEIQTWNLDINSVRELETEIWDFDIMKQILEKMWIKQKAYQETLREVWNINNEVECMIDTWLGLNPFIEIEWKNENIVKKICKIIKFKLQWMIFWNCWWNLF